MSDTFDCKDIRIRKSEIKISVKNLKNQNKLEFSNPNLFVT